MKSICVITGGGSGMGLATAKLLGGLHHLVLVGRTEEKLRKAQKLLQEGGAEVDICPGDVSDKAFVASLAAFAKELGDVKVVIHSAGVSPHMTTADQIFRINAIGTMNVDLAFAEVMDQGVILNVSSMSGYIPSGDRVPLALYRMAMDNEAAFEAGINKMFEMIPEEYRTGMAYSTSKNFVIWFTKRISLKYGRKGLRILSIAPGTFNTPMNDYEAEDAVPFALAGAMGRVGEPEEIAKMMAYLVSDQCSYLCGADVLFDGGSIAQMEKDKEDALMSELAKAKETP